MVKKGLSLLAAAVLLLCAALPVSASAEGGAQSAVEVCWDGCEAEGEYLVFFLPEGVSPAAAPADSILFVDQVRASGEGAIDLLYLDPEFETCEIWLSGEFPDGGASPRQIDHYEAQPAAAIHAPAALSEIEEEAFAGGSFTHVYLSENVTLIDNRAFSDCSALQYVEIPAMSVSIADDAFSGSPHVTIGCLEGSDAYSFAVDNGIPVRIIQH